MTKQICIEPHDNGGFGAKNANDERSIIAAPTQRALGYLNQNPHMVVSVCLFLAGGGALALNFAPLAGSLCGAGGALLGAWITELNKRRTDAEAKAKRQAEVVDALAPELQRVIERVQYIVDRAVANLTCETMVNGIRTKDQQADFRPYRPTLYPSTPQAHDLPGEKAVVLIRFYDSLHDIDNLVNDWWEREGQLAVNIFNAILHAAEKSLRLGLVCIREFDLEERFPPPYETWGTLTSRINRSLDSAAKAYRNYLDRAKARPQGPVNSGEATPFRQY